MLLFLLAALGGCEAEAGRAPSPPTYRWPERFSYRVDYISSLQQSGRELLQYGESRVMRFGTRDDESYLVVPDSVVRTRKEPGRAVELLAYSAEDTLAWFVRLGALGEVTDVLLGCDPATEACRRAMPSVLPLELRRAIPRLSPWPVPRGSSWSDTLTWDDAARGGTRGTLVTTYSVGRDTAIGAHDMWTIEWRATRRVYHPTPEASIAAEPPVREQGITYVDKRSLLPVFAAWVGAVATPGDSGEPAVATGFRGRVYLAGSLFDSLIGGRQ